MPVDLTAIRALLASVAGFTEGPWSPDDELGWIRPPKGLQITGYVQRVNRPLIAAAPDLHRDLTEAVEEIERLRAHNARMVASIIERADAHRYMAEACPDDPTFLAMAAELDALAAGEVDDG